METVLYLKQNQLLGELSHNTMVIDYLRFDLVFDFNSLNVLCGSNSVTMKRKEFLVFRYLAAHTGIVVLRRVLEEMFWEDVVISSNTVDVHISSIRRTIKKLGCGMKIETVYGKGYRLVVE